VRRQWSACACVWSVFGRADRCVLSLGLQKYLNLISQLDGVRNVAEFTYFVTEMTADDGWRESVPATPGLAATRWQWLDEHAPPPLHAPLVSTECVSSGQFRVERGCNELPPWLSDASNAIAAASAAAAATAAAAAAAAQAGSLGVSVDRLPAAAAAALTAPVTPASPRARRAAPSVPDVDSTHEETEHEDGNVSIEEVAERDVLYYRAYLADQPHENHVGRLDDGTPLVLSMASDGVALDSARRAYKALLRTKKGDVRVSLVSSKSNRADRLRELRVKLHLDDAPPFVRVRAETFTKRLIDVRLRVVCLCIPLTLHAVREEATCGALQVWCAVRRCRAERRE
jgi:hypothetical protein